MKSPIASLGGHMTTVLAAFAVVSVVVVLLLGVGGVSIVSGSKYTASATLPTASSLTPGARVTMAGVKVGRVAEVRRRGLGVRVKMEFDDDRVTPLPVDSRVRLTQRTAVGENYIALTRGTSSRTLGPGGVLPISRAEEYVEVDEVLSTLDGPTRARAQQALRGLGDGIDGRGDDLNQLLSGSSRTLQGIVTLADVLHAERTRIAEIVTHLGNVSRAAGERGESVRAFARETLTAFTAVSQSNKELAATLREAPATLTEARATAGALRTASIRSAPVLRNLATAVAELQPAIHQLEPATVSGRAAILELGRAAKPLRSLLQRVRAVSGPAARALPQARSALCQVNPMVRYLAPYAKDLTSLFAGMGSAVNNYDATGHAGRISPIVTEQALVGLPDEVQESLNLLLRTGLLGKTSQLGYNAYPDPGTVGAPVGEPGAISPKGQAGKYRRISADC